MDKISALNQRNPAAIAAGIGQRVQGLRLAKGWTQDELAERSGIAVSTLKLLEAKGRGSLQRLIRVAVVLGIDGELRELFSRSDLQPSIESVKQSERQRAPRRRGAANGT